MKPHQTALLLSIMATIVAIVPTVGQAAGIPIPIFYSYDEEKIVKAAEFPNTDEFKFQSGEHIDAGYRYKQFSIFWIPLWNYDGQWCGYIDSERYVDVSKSKLEEAASKAQVTLPAEIMLPFGPTFGVRIILACIVFIRIYGWFTKKIGSDVEANKKREPSSIETKQVSNQNNELEVYGFGSSVLLIACVAKFSKLEGAITQNQIERVEDIFHDLGYRGETRQRAIEVFNLAKDGRMSFYQCVDLYRELYSEEVEVTTTMILALFSVANADGNMTPTKQNALMRTCNSLSCDYEEFSEFCDGSTTDEEDTNLNDAYSVLGCLPNDPAKLIKERYRRLVKDYHPDTIASKDLPEEFTKFAQNKFNEIQVAYQTIVQTRSNEVF